jgi:UDPglucose 6-dehydrogenase
MLSHKRTTIGIFGAGYVGLVTAACLAELGNTVALYDIDARKIASLRNGELPIHEPGLLELVSRAVRASRLSFSSEPRSAVAGARAVFIAVGTPTTSDGRVDLTHVHGAARAIAHSLDGPTIIVNKSTVPIDTADIVEAIIREACAAQHGAVVVSNPEFLREGSALSDFFAPDRIVLGCGDSRAEAFLRELYAPLNVPIIVTDVRTAQMIKLAANAFLATKISFANEIAAVCEHVGIDIKAVLAAVGADKRIGTAFFGAGLGFGGSCLPKDVNTLCRMAEEADVEPTLLGAVLSVNARQIERIATRIGRLLNGLPNRQIGVLGLAFKAHTGDVRDSTAIMLIETLILGGARVRVHDPAAMSNARALLGDRVTYALVDDCLSVAKDADALVLATDWPVYRELDFLRLHATMRRKTIIDARNFYEPAQIARAGFHYEGVGRFANLTDPENLQEHAGCSTR